MQYRVKGCFDLRVASTTYLPINYCKCKSSNVNEVIRAVLNSLFFYEKILHAPKVPKAQRRATKQKHKTLQANSKVFN